MVAPSSTLYVAGIDQSVSTSTLEEEFSRYGKVEKVTIIKDKMTMESKGFAYILMSSIEDAQKSLKEMDGKVIGDKPIKVKFSFSDTPGPPPDSRGSYRGRGGGGGRYMERGGSRFPSSSYRGSSDRGSYGGGGYRGRGSDRGSRGRGGFSDRGRGGYRIREDYGRPSRGGGRGRGTSRYDTPSYRDREEYPRRDLNGSYDDYDRGGRAPSVRNIDSYSRGPSRDSYSHNVSRESYGRGASDADYGRPAPRYEGERRSSFTPRDTSFSEYRDRSPPSRGGGGYEQRPVRSSMTYERDRFDDRTPPRRPIRPDSRSEQYRDERPIRRDYDSMPTSGGRHESYSAPRSSRDYDPAPRRPAPRESGGYAGYGNDPKDDYGAPPKYTRSYNARDY